MTTIVIDKTRALELLAAAVEARGADYIYQAEFGPECSYVARPLADYDEDGELVDDDRGPTPACIGGEALKQAGVQLGYDDLRESLPRLAGFCELVLGGPLMSEIPFNDAEAFATKELRDTCESELAALDVELTEAATRVWWAAQRMQDHGETWGAAYDKASEVAALLGDVA